MRNYFFGANWKMNMSIKDAQQFFQNWEHKTFMEKTTLVFFPTQYTLGYLQENYGQEHLFGAQNLTFYPKGAYTGESNPELVSMDKIPYALVGHSERREYFFESDQDVHSKIQSNLQYHIKSVLCVGESLTLRENQQYVDFIKNQLKIALDGIRLKHPSELVIAYEPIWAIGTGKTATVEQIQEIHSIIRKEIANYNLPAEEICIIYGGSVNVDNAYNILSLEDVDGALIGGASLKAESLQTIIQAASIQ